MSWMGILFLLAGIYLTVLIVRGFIDFCRWLFEDWGSGPAASSRENRAPRRNRPAANKIRGGDSLHPRIHL